jgi:hypothetical protein
MEEIKQENLKEATEKGATPLSQGGQEKNTIWKGVFFLILSAFFFSLIRHFPRFSNFLG